MPKILGCHMKEKNGKKWEAIKKNQNHQNQNQLITTTIAQNNQNSMVVTL
jgi:hypothetical protein